MAANIQSTICDFNQFINFIERERPVLSATLGVFGKKDCFKLNMDIDNKKEVVAPTYNQEQYPAIDLMFELALAGCLYVKGNNEKGKLSLRKTPNLESYQTLNDHEKYVFLLQTYWTQYPFEKKFDRWLGIDAFYNTLVAIANAEDGQSLVNNGQYSSSRMYSEGAAFLHHLRFFGLGELELVEGAKGKYEDTIRACIPNAFGIETSRFLIVEALLNWNKNGVKVLLSTENMKALPKKAAQPFDVFKTIFSDKQVTRTVEAPQETDSSGIYTFKVSWRKTVWRKIITAYTHSFEELHAAIQDAFDFDDDHLYAFYIGGDQRSGTPICCADAEGKGTTAEETRIGDLSLYEGQKMLYLFDFGDEWKFDIELLTIDKEASLPLKPMITESKGEAPEQYGRVWY